MTDNKKELINKLIHKIESERMDKSDTLIDNYSLWERHLRLNCMGDITNIQTNYPNDNHITIDISKVINSQLREEIIITPGKSSEDIISTLKSMWPDEMLNKASKIDIRYTNVPQKRKVRDLKVIDEGKLIGISCLVKRTSSVYPDITKAFFLCDDLHITGINAKNGIIEPPHRCATDGCKNKHFTHADKKDIKQNAQNIYVQDILEELEGGVQPESIRCKVIEQHCNKVMVGDRITINGILRSIPRIKDGKIQTGKTTYIEVNNIERSQSDYDEVKITETDEQSIKLLAAMPDCFEHLSKSIAPSIHGMQLMKRAVLLQLFEGVCRTLPDGTKRRGHINILVVSDPGMGKTVLLTFVKSIAPRGVFAVASTSSKVGLIAPVVRDEITGQYVLEAGAYMLANGGILCLDEASELGKDEMKTLGEAMEQGSVHINKAGINAEVQTRASLLMACNPIGGSFDMFPDEKGKGLAAQVNIPDQILSRCDLKLLMTDFSSKTSDADLAGYILDSYTGENEIKFKTVPPELLRKYIAYARRIDPAVTKEASTKINEYFVNIRAETGNGDAMKITNRQIHSILHFAEAHARMRLSKTVDAIDAQEAINLFDMCFRNINTDAQGRLNMGMSEHKGKEGLPVQIIKTIREIGGETKKASEMSVIAALKKKGFDSDKIESVIRMLLKDGKLSEPLNGLLQVM